MKHRSYLKAMLPQSDQVFLSQREPPQYDAETHTLFTSSIDAFLEAAPDWVIICSAATNHHQHIAKVVTIANAVLIEKPLAATLLQAKQIETAQQNSNCPMVVGYNLRFLEGITRLKQVLEQRIIGQLYSVQVTVGQNLELWRPERPVVSTVSAQKSMGGGVLRELSHELDIMQMLFGQPQASTMMASASKYTKFDVEDTAFIQAHYRPGTFTDHPFLASINMDFVRRDATRQMVFIGDKGTLFYDLLAGTLTIKNEISVTAVCTIADDIAQSYERMWTAFANQEFDRFCSINEAVNTIKLVETLEQENYHP